METKSSFAKALRETHNALMGHLRFLAESVQPTSTDSPPEVRTRLEKIRTHLHNHFRFEEEGGYMAPILSEEPRLGAEVNKLLGEHGVLANGLDAILDEFRAAEALLDVLREKVRTWLKDVHHHEAHENHVVQEAYSTDLASGD